MALNLRRRTTGLLLGAAVSAAGLTACGTDAGTVATIDDVTISQKQFEADIDAALADPVTGEQVEELGSAYRASYLNDVVTAEIAKAIAENEGEPITDADVDAKLEELIQGQSIEDALAQSAMSGDPVTEKQLRMRVARGLVTDMAAEKALGVSKDEMTEQQLAQIKAQRDANPGQFTTYDLAITATQDQMLAADWEQKAKAGTPLKDAVAGNPDPNMPTGSAEAVVEESLTGADLAQQPDILNQLQQIPAGTTGTIVSGPDQTGIFTYFVVTVKSATAATDEQLQTQAEQAADQQFMEAGLIELAKQAEEVDVEVNPRYGTIEYPEQGLPSVTVPSSDNFTEPAPETPTVPGLPAGL
ncbi:hypothetical protein [Blastococcus sp. Marseille-P5729]|uniref:hypothetical protein n=1 Tax=Blastococcus sp. Marseille-P5729 TaxID=2086582 RepID=UPI000D0EE1E0|nr:hypothetical protein [Blastococcus sp. Marseille-P5729]